MERKHFKSRLFNKSISTDNLEYWQILYAEVLFRLKELDDLKCTCSFCFRDRVHLNHIIDSLIKENHIKENKKPINFTGVGDCGRKMNPVA